MKLWKRPRVPVAPCSVSKECCRVGCPGWVGGEVPPLCSHLFIWKMYRERVREKRGRDTERCRDESSICWFISQDLSRLNAALYHELYPGLLCDGRSPFTCTIFHCLAMCTIRELDQKWSSKGRPHGIPPSLGYNGSPQERQFSVVMLLISDVWEADIM